jgi:hypothetical protein
MSHLIGLSHWLVLNYRETLEKTVFFELGSCPCRPTMLMCIQRAVRGDLMESCLKLTFNLIAPLR